MSFMQEPLIRISLLQDLGAIYCVSGYRRLLVTEDGSDRFLMEMNGRGEVYR
jgi:hypothetical protein